MALDHRLAVMGPVLLGTFMLIAQAPSVMMIGPQQREEIRQVVERGMACKHIPGLAVAVVKDGQVLMTEGYGVKDHDTQERVTSDTKFLIASLTKAFTATLLANVMDTHNLKISTNVNKTLEEDFKFNDSLRNEYATVEDLLAHRTGIPRNNYVRLSTDYTIQSFAGKIRYLPSKGGRFRNSFYYNDLMYGLSAYITEQLQGQTPWKQQVRDTIFSPLGMTNSTFVNDVDFDNDDVATPYAHEDGQTVKVSADFIKHWGRNLGSGNIMSSASDMARWMLMLLNDGRDSQNNRVMRKGVVEGTFSPRNVLRSSYTYKYRKPQTPFSFTADTYGLAWRNGYYKGYKMYYHSGSSFGYRAYLTLLPEMNVGVVSLMTGEDYQYRFRTALNMYLMDRALGHDPWINSTTICTYPEPWLSASASASRKKRSSDRGDEPMQLVDDLNDEGRIRRVKRQSAVRSCVSRGLASSMAQKYTGSYQHAAYGSLHVTYNATSGGLMLEYGIGQWCLHPAVRQHEFIGEWLKDPPTIDKGFAFKCEGNGINALEATGFEPRLPPLFRR